MRSSLRWMLLLFLLALPVAGHAQGTVEEAATLYGNAIKAGDWATAARMMNPDALKPLREIFGALLELPETAAAGEQLFGTRSAAEFAALPDTVVFARMIERILGQNEMVREAMRTATLTPLGHVSGGGDTLLVVVRVELQMSGVKTTSFEVNPWIKSQGKWQALLRADFANLAAMMRQRLQRGS